MTCQFESDFTVVTSFYGPLKDILQPSRDLLGTSQGRDNRDLLKAYEQPIRDLKGTYKEHLGTYYGSPRDLIRIP